MRVTLYMFSGSNAVLTAQLMLEHKGITEYRRVNLPPGAHALIMLGKGFETRERSTSWFPSHGSSQPIPSGVRRSRKQSAGASSCRTLRDASSTAWRDVIGARSRPS